MNNNSTWFRIVRLPIALLWLPIVILFGLLAGDQEYIERYLREL